MKPETKQEIVRELAEKLAGAKIVVLTDYKGLNVAAMTDLRRRLRQADVEYRVIKNTLLTRAAQGTPVEVLSDRFVGPNEVAISYDDPVAPAKVLADFAKENDKLEITAAALGGKGLDAAQVKALANLPSREVLLAQVLAVMNQVPTSFVRTINGIPQKLLNVLQAIKEQKEAA